MSKMVDDGELKYDEKSKLYSVALVDSAPDPATEAEEGFMQ